MTILDDTLSKLQNALSSTSASSGEWSQDWETAKNQLIQKADEFAQAYNDMISKQSIIKANPQLADEYDALMSKGDYIKSTVQNITGSFDAVSGWFNNVLTNFTNSIGLSGLPIQPNYNEIAKRTGMGFIGVVSVAVISVCIAAIVYWLQDYEKFNTKVQLVEKAASQSTQQQDVFKQIWEAVMGGGSTSGNIKDASKYIAIAGVSIAALYFLWPVIKRLK